MTISEDATFFEMSCSHCSEKLRAHRGETVKCGCGKLTLSLGPGKKEDA